MIVKPEDFVGTALVPNAKDENIPLEGFAGNPTELKLFIDDYEPEALITVLGFDLYQEFIANLDPDTGEPLPGADQKWTDLLNGKGRYRGIKKMIVHYVFFNFYNNDTSHYSGVGTVKENPKGATPYDVKEKAVKSWRIFRKEAVGSGSVHGAVIRKNSGVGVIYGGSTNNEFQSVQEFILDNKEEYPNYSFIPIQNMNYYGL